jgi:hypothetical protein
MGQCVNCASFTERWCCFDPKALPECFVGAYFHDFIVHNVTNQPRKQNMEFAHAYFDQFEGLTPEECKDLLAGAKLQTEKLISEMVAGGNPNERVFRNVTRGLVYDKLSKSDELTVKGVAELGSTYAQAYQNVIPWLKKDGFNIKG